MCSGEEEGCAEAVVGLDFWGLDWDCLCHFEESFGGGVESEAIYKIFLFLFLFLAAGWDGMGCKDPAPRQSLLPACMFRGIYGQVNNDDNYNYSTYSTTPRASLPDAAILALPILQFRLRSFLLSILLFSAITFILASTRLGPRLTSLFTHLRPYKYPSTYTIRPITNSTMAPPQYQSPPQAPPLFTATALSLVEDAKRICTTTRTLLDRIAADVTPETATFENTVLPLALDENTSGLESRIIGFYQAVSTDPALRDASSKAEEIMDAFSIEASMREDIFILVDAAFQKSEKLDPESQRLLEKERKSYITNGLGIPKGPNRDRFKEIKMRLSQIQIEFQKNLNEENGGIWFTAKQLEGVPEDVLQGLEKGEGDNEGMMRLSFKYPDLFPALKFAVHAETREKVFIENENKVFLPFIASFSFWVYMGMLTGGNVKCNANVPLFKEAIVLRDEAARLVGYPNHAAFRIEDKMAKTPETVNEFLDDLRTQLTPGGAKEVEHLLELKKEDLKARGLDTSDGNYYLWDSRFYNRLMVEKEFSIDESKIAEYFPLESTVNGMLGIFQELFGFVFVELVGEDRTKLSGMCSLRSLISFANLE